MTETTLAAETIPGTLPGLSLTLLAARAGHAAALRDAVQAGWNITLPQEPRWVAAGQARFLWFGPHRWLVVGSETNPPPLAPLAAHACLTDLSDGRVVVAIDGPAARTRLAKLLPIDLHPGVFAPGHVALTLAGHVNVALWQTDALRYELSFYRSFTGYMLDWLEATK